MRRPVRGSGRKTADGTARRHGRAFGRPVLPVRWWLTSVSAGNTNTASGTVGAWVGGGFSNTSSGSSSSLSGGSHHTSSGSNTSVLGGLSRTLSGPDNESRAGATTFRPSPSTDTPRQRWWACAPHAHHPRPAVGFRTIRTGILSGPVCGPGPLSSLRRALPVPARRWLAAFARSSRRPPRRIG